MRRTRLFPTLVLFGASLTGGAVATVASVSLAVGVSGCGDTTSNSDMDMATGQYFDIGVPFYRDMAAPRPDCGLPCSPRDLEPGD